MGTDIHLAAEYYQEGRWHLAHIELPCYRNYRAFAILADVRNGYTFAGFDTGDPVIPISEPRDLPEDMSEELRAMMGENEQCDEGPENGSEDAWLDEEPCGIWLGDHSFSWVTLQELLDYDIDQPVTLRGMVSSEAARRWQENREPPAVVAGHSSEPGWVHLEWTRPLSESASLISDLIDALTPLGDPPHVRLIFGFDS